MRYGLLAFGILFSPILTLASMTSEEYTLSPAVLGSVGNESLSSESYVLTPQDGSEGERSEPGVSGNGRSIGSRSRTLSPQTFIGGGTTTPNEVPVSATVGVRSTPLSEGFRLPSPKNATRETVEQGEEEGGEDGKAKDSDEIKVDRSNLGAVIASDMSRIFENRTPRVVFLFFVLAFLWYLRTYTRVGKRYRPF